MPSDSSWRVSTSGTEPGQCLFSLKLKAENKPNGAAVGSMLTDPNEVLHSKNSGLGKIAAALNPIPAMYNVSPGDVLHLAGVLGVLPAPADLRLRHTLAASGPRTLPRMASFPPQQPGRKPHGSLADIGFTVRELMALIGAHSTGKQRFYNRSGLRALPKHYSNSRIVDIWDVYFCEDILPSFGLRFSDIWRFQIPRLRAAPPPQASSSSPATSTSRTTRRRARTIAVTSEIKITGVTTIPPLTRDELAGNRQEHPHQLLGGFPQPIDLATVQNLGGSFKQRGNELLGLRDSPQTAAYGRATGTEIESQPAIALVAAAVKHNVVQPSGRSIPTADTPQLGRIRDVLPGKLVQRDDLCGAVALGVIEHGAELRGWSWRSMNLSARLLGRCTRFRATKLYQTKAFERQTLTAIAEPEAAAERRLHRLDSAIAQQEQRLRERLDEACAGEGPGGLSIIRMRTNARICMRTKSWPWFNIGVEMVDDETRELVGATASAFDELSKVLWGQSRGEYELVQSHPTHNFELCEVACIQPGVNKLLHPHRMFIRVAVFKITSGSQK
ncbi:hypothetical protein B0H17DRAFT_1148688 [Mycena rosella]|uniref:Peroxidase n=1 Tax=Mycena rosella TaxID=1033263 RepID=A0AAD7FX76_MYCRO|nr:hypothetical protein B0H17DRAFT_1148688 [Mycena rosella]